MNSTSTMKRFNVRKLTVTAMLSAVATVLMFFSFNVPLMPSFIKLDLSELPALIASFSMGPVAGAVVFSTTGGVGELSNFLLGCCFVVPAGIVYQRKQNLAGAVIGSISGSAAMAVLSVFTNYFVVYPIYTAFLPMETIMGMYQAINPNVETLWQALLLFNMPFTFIKGLCSVVITLLIYKGIAPVLQGRQR